MKFSLPELILPKKKYFGLSIERNALHAVELDDNGKIIKAAEVLVQDGIFQDGEIIYPDDFIQEIKSIVSQGKFTTPYVAVCIPEVFAYTRGFSLPIIDLNEVQEAISWHTKDLFPFPPEEIYFDWKLLQKNEHEYKTTVVAIQKKILDPILQALISAGLKPLRFEPDALALARLLLLKSDAQAILLEINTTGAYVTLVQGDKSLFTTIIGYSANESAQSYLSNIDQTIIEMNSYYKNKNIIMDNIQVFVTGMMATEDWVKHFHELLNYPCSLLTTPIENRAYHKAYTAASFIISPPLDEQSINLLPAITQSYYDQERSLSFYKAFLKRICIISLIIVIGAFISFFSLSLERQALDNRVKNIRKLTQSQQSDTQGLLMLNAQAKNIVNLAPFRKTVKDKLTKIQALLNNNISISNWEYDDSKLGFKIVGIAQTRQNLLELKNKLDSSPDFSQVTLPLGSLETPVQVPFEITFVTK
jgi:Tfp pilus assembly PilM family ATPase